MASINLSRSGQRADSKSSLLVGTAFLVSSGLLLVVAVVYVGLLAYNGFVDRQMTSKRDSIAALNKQMASPEVASVTDFSRRSEEVDKHLKSVTVPSDTLVKIEQSIIPEVTITGYTRTVDGGIALKIRTNAIKNIARQLLSFKTDFDTVAIGSISVDTDGIFQGQVTMMDRPSTSVTVQ